MGAGSSMIYMPVLQGMLSLGLYPPQPLLEAHGEWFRLLLEHTTFKLLIQDSGCLEGVRRREVVIGLATSLCKINSRASQMLVPFWQPWIQLHVHLRHRIFNLPSGRC